MPNAKALARAPFMKKVMKAMKKVMRPKRVMQAKPPKKVMQAKPMKRPAAAKWPTDCYGCEVEPWHDCAAGPDEPNWAAHFVDVLRAPLEKLHRKLPHVTPIVLWSDCAGQKKWRQKKFAMS